VARQSRGRRFGVELAFAVPGSICICTWVNVYAYWYYTSKFICPAMIITVPQGSQMVENDDGKLPLVFLSFPSRSKIALTLLCVNSFVDEAFVILYERNEYWPLLYAYEEIIQGVMSRSPLAALDLL
jgi:hypothetical protein